MNKELGKKYLAYGRIESVLDAYPDAVKSIPGLETAGNSFSQLLSGITGAAVPKVEDTKGVTEKKNYDLSLGVTRTGVVMFAIKAYADANGDKVLAGKVPSTLSELTEGDIVKQLSRFASVLAESKKMEDKLTGYGASPEYIAGLEALLKDLRSNADAPRKAIDQRLKPRIGYLRGIRYVGGNVSDGKEHKPNGKVNHS